MSAGFDIGETMVAYDPSQSYGKALLVGVLAMIPMRRRGTMIRRRVPLV